MLKPNEILGENWPNRAPISLDNEKFKFVDSDNRSDKSRPRQSFISGCSAFSRLADAPVGREVDAISATSGRRMPKRGSASTSFSLKPKDASSNPNAFPLESEAAVQEFNPTRSSARLPEPMRSRSSPTP